MERCASGPIFFRGPGGPTLAKTKDLGKSQRTRVALEHTEVCNQSSTKCARSGINGRSLPVSCSGNRE
jgi:hypothetical protein